MWHHNAFTDRRAAWKWWYSCNCEQSVGLAGVVNRGDSQKCRDIFASWQTLSPFWIGTDGGAGTCKLAGGRMSCSTFYLLGTILLRGWCWAAEVGSVYFSDMNNSWHADILLESDSGEINIQTVKMVFVDMSAMLLLMDPCQVDSHFRRLNEPALIVSHKIGIWVDVSFNS